MTFSKYGKAAAERVLAGIEDPAKNPFYRERGQVYLKFDQLRIEDGPTDEFGRLQRTIIFSHSGVDLYSMVVEFESPKNTITVSGFDASMGVTLS